MIILVHGLSSFGRRRNASSRPVWQNPHTLCRPLVGSPPTDAHFRLISVITLLVLEMLLD